MEILFGHYKDVLGKIPEKIYSIKLPQIAKCCTLKIKLK
jgi:hypothetical protein